LESASLGYDSLVLESGSVSVSGRIFLARRNEGEGWAGDAPGAIRVDLAVLRGVGCAEAFHCIAMNTNCAGAGSVLLIDAY
jgi:hypothetical protein